MEKKILVRRVETAPTVQRCEHPRYEYKQEKIVTRKDSENFDVSIYEVPPGKSAVPYHYHVRNEEIFYILSGTGLLKTPDEEREVAAGDFIYFPNNSSGAHKLTNTSETEPLRYMDIDIRYDFDVVFYPDSNKVGIYGKGNHLIFPVAGQTEYYAGE
ncbi:MAG: cupin domain-containing protein [Planctomycetaceae bacterium]|nr:cupin domain-containing protein [Planctomycetaceae bacterium]